MRVEMKPGMQRKVNRYGSVLKAFRSQGGTSLGFGTSSVLLLTFGICMIPWGLLLLIAAASEPDGGAELWIVSGVMVGLGLLLLVLRAILRAVRTKNYLSYYEKQTGYSERELQEADRELMSYSAVKIGERMHYYARKPTLMYIVTKHYFFAVGSAKGAYLRKLEDIAAAFYSCQIPQGISSVCREGLFVISKQDISGKPRKNRITKKWYGGFESGMMALSEGCDKLCGEVLEEIGKGAPYIIPYQNIVVNGVPYNLLSLENWQADWARILGR